MDAMKRRRVRQTRPANEAGEAQSCIVQEAEAEEPGVIGARLTLVLRLAGGLAVALVIIGTVIAVITQGKLPTATVPIGSLPSSLLRFQPEAILTLGIMLFAAAPVFGLGYLAQAFFRLHDRLYALIAAVVLLILLSSILLTLGLQGL